MPSSEMPPRPLARTLRAMVSAVVVAIGAFCLLLLAVRFVVLPQVAARPQMIAQWLATKFAQPVSIAAVTTDWDGWNPRVSIRGLRVGGTGAGAQALLDLPRVDLVVAWTSLPLLELRLKELVIESPRLFVRRDRDGVLHVAGVEMVNGDASGDRAVADWLMRQPHVLVHDALLVWDDELRGVPQLLLDHVNFRLDHRFGRVRIGLTGAPPPELAAPIDLRADLSGGSSGNSTDLAGRIYLRLDYADLAAWANWLPLPVRIDRGEGALRMWIDVKASRPVQVIADVEVSDLRTVLDPALTPLVLEHLSGRLTWAQSAHALRVGARRVALTLPGGAATSSGRVDLVITDAAGGPGHGKLTIDRAELAPLAAISAHLPLPAAWRDEMAALAPRGALADATLAWTGEMANPDSVEGHVRFADLSTASHGRWPGLEHLSGTLDAGEDRGTLVVSGKRASVALPWLLAAPIALESISGRVTWDHRDGPLTVSVDELSFANADAAGIAAGTWRDEGAGPGRVKVTAQLTRANAAAVWRYLPSDVPRQVRAWLHDALTGGRVTAASLALDGDLAEFPFRAGAGGTFQVAVHVRDATLAYAEGWPALRGIEADVRFAGAGLAIDANRAAVIGTQIGEAHVNVRDLGAAKPVLAVTGTADGPATAFLDFVTNSPVAQWIDYAGDSISASGPARLALAFELPLDDPAAARVDGTLSLDGNSIRVGNAPPIDSLSGELHFTDQGVDARALAGRFLDGPATFSLTGRSGTMKVAASGDTDLSRLREAFALPWLDRVSGSAPWKLDAGVRDGSVAWTADATLDRAIVDLPAPLAKPAGVAARLHIERTPEGPLADRLVVECSCIDRMRAIVVRRDDGSAWRPERVQVAFGKAAEAGAPAAIGSGSVRGTVSTLDADGWLALVRSQVPVANRSLPALTRIDLDADALVLIGRRFPRTRVEAIRAGDHWRLTFAGRDLEGHATWQPASAQDPDGKVVARFARLTLPRPRNTASETPGASTASAAAVSSGASAAPRSATGSAERWPTLDLEAASFMSRDHALGALTIDAVSTGDDWNVRRLSIANDAGSIDAHGVWHAAAADPVTTLEATVTVKEAGAFMARFGWPAAVKGAPSKIAGRITWKGSPADFDYASLSGAFTLETGAGQFTKIEPGVGRLLGVLSLQALPRRLGLDFRDVFSAGFAFDSVRGAVTMKEGIMHTDDLRLTGPSAVVDIAGDADLARETQKLRVKVEPALASGISAGAAALFLANPLVGAAVGAGTLLAQKLLDNPVDQLFSYRYLVTGSWDDPIVERIDASKHANEQVPVR